MPEELANLFDRSWQAQRKNRDGVGLGLAIVRGIVEAHGGRVWAESALGEGTRVHFTLAAPKSASPVVDVLVLERSSAGRIRRCGRRTIPRWQVPMWEP